MAHGCARLDAQMLGRYAYECVRALFCGCVSESCAWVLSHCVRVCLLIGVWSVLYCLCVVCKSHLHVFSCLRACSSCFMCCFVRECVVSVYCVSRLRRLCRCVCVCCVCKKIVSMCVCCVCLCEWVSEWVSIYVFVRVCLWVSEWVSECLSVCLCVCGCVCVYFARVFLRFNSWSRQETWLLQDLWYSVRSSRYLAVLCDSSAEECWKKNKNENNKSWTNLQSTILHRSTTTHRRQSNLLPSKVLCG